MIKSDSLLLSMSNLNTLPSIFPNNYHVMEGDTSYHIILGRPWLRAHKGVASTYHQCVKAIWQGKPITIEAIRIPYDRAELHYVEAALY